MVLGSMLTSINSLNAAADTIDENDFYFAEHRLVFHVLKEAFRQDRPMDVHLACEELKRQGKLQTVGGVGFVTELAQYAGTSAYIEEYVSIVRAKSILRRMIFASQEIERSALSDPQDVYDLLDTAQHKFFVISQAANDGVGVLLEDLLKGTKATSQKPYLQELQGRQELFRQGGPSTILVPGVPSGFVDLDKITHGLGNANLIIVAGRPAMGKTALAMNMAEFVCFQEHLPVGVFSLEMSAEQLMHRLISSQSGVESDKIKNGSLNGNEYQRIVAAVNEMQNCTMVIDDQPGVKITDLRARARRMKEAYNIRLLVIDYLQLLSGSGYTRSAENRQNEISEISRMLKNLARELNIPILCPSQLSRKVEDRAGHRPLLSDLRESGSIEQDGDVVLMLFRKDYYDLYDKPGQAELIIAKNRHGGTGSVYLSFRKECAKFANHSALSPPA